MEWDLGAKVSNAISNGPGLTLNWQLLLHVEMNFRSSCALTDCPMWAPLLPWHT